MVSSQKKMNKINFWNKVLFYSYSVIGSHSRLFLAIKLPAKINLPKVDYFSTWQFNLYDKSDGNPSEIQGMTLLDSAYIVYMYNERRSLPRSSCNAHAQFASWSWLLFGSFSATLIRWLLALIKKPPFNPTKAWIHKAAAWLHWLLLLLTCLHVSKK